jgi:DNA-binding transcriptional LysR family regulator
VVAAGRSVQRNFLDMTRKIGCMIDVRRLRVLRALADHGTVAAAAQALHLTPSAVSQQLAALEREVGQPVAERRGRGLVLTGTADVLLEHAHALFAQLERAEADVAAHARGELGTVVVGAFPTALAAIAAPATEALAAAHPGLRLELRDVESPHCFAALAEEAIDVAISMESASAPAPGDPRFARRPLLDDPLDAVLPAGHTLAARSAVALDALAGETWVGPSPATSCLEVTLAGCAAAGFTPQLVHRTNDFTTLMTFVAAGLGVALVPRLAQGRIPPGVAVVPLRGVAPARRVFAATRRGSEARPTVAAVLDALADAALVAAPRPALAIVASRR